MKGHIVRTACFVAIFLGLAAVAPAQGHRACSNAGIAGAWAYTETGTVIAPAPMGAVPAAAVGRYTFDREGDFSGTQHSSAGGNVSADIKEGTYTVNHDCTGTLVLSVYVYRNGVKTLVRDSVWAIVLADDAREFRGIMISMMMWTYPPGAPAVSVPLPPIMTISAKRIFSGDRGRQQDEK